MVVEHGLYMAMVFSALCGLLLASRVGAYGDHALLIVSSSVIMGGFVYAWWELVIGLLKRVL